LDLSISIVNWNTRDDLRQALTAIYNSGTKASFEVIVVDNASTDSSVAMLESEFPQVRVISNDANRGFGAAHNQAFNQGTGRYRMPLNPDALVQPGGFDKLIACAESDPKIGVIGPKLLYPDGSLQYSCRRFPSIGAALFRNALFDKLFPKNRFANDYLMRDWDHNSHREVGWVSGAAMLIRGELLDKVGAFDEQFFMYCEDTDLCFRARQSGYSVYYCPEAVAIHTVGRSSDAVPNRMTLQHHKSMYLYFKKHTAEQTAWYIRPLVPLGLWMRAFATIGRNVLYMIWRRIKREKAR
jgi:GT2 family glycosyltransferase